MGMFKSNSKSGGGGRPAKDPSDGAISPPGPRMNIVGDVETEGTVRVEGRVQGKVRAGRGVVVGRDGEVVGDIETEDAVLGGRVSGMITVRGRLELQSTCEIDGEIRTRANQLQLEEGARFNGEIHMLEEAPQKALPAGSDAEPELSTNMEHSATPTGAIT
ncbi:hypothetical protein BH23GEM4_BH23GEM4_10100 [soil metagenome]